MLGKKQRHRRNLSRYHQPHQDVALPQRINPPKANNVSGSTSELQQAHKPTRAGKSRKADLKDSNGREGETSTFISGTAEAPEPPCCPALSQAWSVCKAIFCCIVTCGDCFRDCQSSIQYPYIETLTDESRECNGHSPNSPASSSPTEKNWSQTKKSVVGSSFSYPDVKLKGVPVYPNRSPSSHTDADSCYKEPLPEKNSSAYSLEKQPVSTSNRSSEELYSFHELDIDGDFFDPNSSMSSIQIDTLIFKKLRELFSVHQIDELAKCTSDTVFLEKTNKISDLINSITQDYHLDEQDAECRLVRGIIRISTRKSQVRPRVLAPTLPSQEESMNRGNLPDSGNGTMLASVLPSEEDLSVQISVETPADVKARIMRHGAYSSTAMERGKVLYQDLP
ncbi:keratinocyte differentiation factor 1 isoform X2 [Rhineura floridana]|uniref:keratinocyte differentiation factor 1 isoform X2 n=1 Tax=Rhineura floridana TaxID=261503 RepID=UPI002AC88509|nr:keratinocyte differentiation factor 1 isoform X2 [Rhineura floridana]